MSKSHFRNDIVYPDGKPVQKPMRRHIVLDNINKVVYIEVQSALNGNPKRWEYDNICSGQYAQYLPGEMKEDIIRAVSNGYRVVPFLATGAANEQYYVIQLVEMFKNNILAGHAIES